MNDAFLSLLGLARRSGRMSMGFDDVVAAAKSGKCELIVTTCDISDKTYKEVTYYSNGCKIVKTKYSQADIKGAIGRPVKVLAINDRGFAVKLISDWSLI